MRNIMYTKLMYILYYKKIKNLKKSRFYYYYIGDPQSKCVKHRKQRRSECRSG